MKIKVKQFISLTREFVQLCFGIYFGTLFLASLVLAPLPLAVSTWFNTFIEYSYKGLPTIIPLMLTGCLLKFYIIFIRKEFIHDGAQSLQNSAKAVHEAGHYVAAEYFGYQITQCKIEQSDRCKESTLYALPNNPDDTDLFNLAVIAYAGIYAEKLILGYVSTCTFQTNENIEDINKADNYLTQYIMMTQNISLTGYEQEIVKAKIIELSKLCKNLAKYILETKREHLEGITQILQTNGEVPCIQ